MAAIIPLKLIDDPDHPGYKKIAEMEPGDTIDASYLNGVMLISTYDTNADDIADSANDINDGYF